MEVRPPGRKPKLTADRLLAAAERLWQEGVGDVTPRVLAAACRVSVATVYRVARREQGLRERLGLVSLPQHIRDAWGLKRGDHRRRVCCSCGPEARAVKNGSYRTRGGQRRQQWRCNRCRRTIRYGTLSYRRRWPEPVITSLADIFRRTRLEQLAEVTHELSQALGIPRRSLYRASRRFRRGRLHIGYLSGWELDRVCQEWSRQEASLSGGAIESILSLIYHDEEGRWSYW